MTFFRKSFSQLSFIITEQLFRSGANMLTGVLLGRAVDKIEYGLYTLLFSFMIMILEIQSGFTGLPYVSLRTGRNENSKDYFLGNILVYHLLLSFLLLFISFSIAAFVSVKPVWGMRSSIVMLFSVFMAAAMLREFLRQVLLSTLEVKKAMYFGIVVNGTSILILIIIYLYETLSLDKTYSILIATSILPSCAVIFYIRKRINFNRDSFISDVKDSFQVGKWIVGRALLTMLSGPLILNSRLVSNGRISEVALYGACMVPSSILSPLANALISFMVPKLSYANSVGKSEVVKITSRFTVLLLVLLLVFNFSIYFFSDKIMMLIFNGKYLPNPFLLLMFTIQMSVIIYAIPVNSALIALNMTKSGFTGELIASVITVVLGWSLVSRYGIWGLVWTLLISKTANRTYQIYIYKKILKI